MPLRPRPSSSLPIASRGALASPRDWAASPRSLSKPPIGSPRQSYSPRPPRAVGFAADKGCRPISGALSISALPGPSSMPGVCHFYFEKIHSLYRLTCLCQETLSIAQAGKLISSLQMCRTSNVFCLCEYPILLMTAKLGIQHCQY